MAAGLPSRALACLQRVQCAPSGRCRVGPRRPGPGGCHGDRARRGQLMFADVVLPRAQWPTFIVRTQTVYRVPAPSSARALHWFADPEDIDLDVETLDFGEVEIVGQVDAEPEDVRYVLTDQGRRALATALLFDRGPTVA